ncbi:MAG: SUMF1/EgtB/PvdO family nonheme iron enzyme [Caldilineaceae bacterium]
MPKLPGLPLRGRGSNPPVPGSSNREPQASRFRLRPTTKEQSQLEWQFGTEENDLFQLRATVNAPTDGLTLDQPKATGRSQARPLGGRSRPEWEQWRKPAVEPAYTPAQAPSSTPSPLQGEIVDEPVSAATELGWNGNGKIGNGEWQRGRNTGAAAVDPFWGEATVGISPGLGSLSNAVANPPAQNGRSTRPSAARSNLTALFTGEEGMRRVLATRMALDEAIDRWWTNSELAPLSLLRDGLLVLEAGHDLDETQRSFLLRTALRTERGMITALHYQIDTDRTAFLIKEALLDTKHAFAPALIDQLRREDERSEEWIDYLEHDLAYEATVATGKRSQLAATALKVMTQNVADATAALSPLPANDVRLPAALGLLAPLVTAATVPHRTVLQPLSHRWSLRWLLWALLILALLISYGEPQVVTSASMVSVPAGSYLISDPASSNPAESGRLRTVALPAYRIDRHEVTNAAYRRCWEQEICPIPSSFDSAGRSRYFINRAFDRFPVVNIDWSAANTYCAWLGKRLPSLEEWEVAASLAPATGLRYPYPWGDRFEKRVVNSAASGFKDTQAVGTYHPADSTPLGIMDMAGNVAEWTAMPASSMIDGFVVKGGLLFR